MFAKLKEKIQKEGGNVSDTEKTLSPLPGHASPRRSSFNNVPGTPIRKDKLGTEMDSGISSSSSPAGGLSSDEAMMQGDAGTREEIIAKLQKKNEQCKKLEAKISEYAAIIKEKNKNVEKLEGFIEKQQDAAAKRSQELNEQYQSQRVALIDSYKQQLEEKEKEKEELESRLKIAEEARDEHSKKEEEKEEIVSLTSQELEKVKHMLTVAQTEVAEKTKDLEVVEKQVNDCNNQITSLTQKLGTLQTERDKLEEERRGHMSLVSSLTKEKLVFEKRVEQLNTDLTEKMTSISALQSKNTDLENNHQALIRNSEQQKNKLNQLLQERADHIEQLQERIQTLEQRGIDQNLSGDERVEALEKERDSLERKLTETREQLSQMKSSWSEKISHLEEQISHLNAKIVEDNEELAHAQKTTESVRENLHGEIEQLREKLKEEEKQSLENWELAKNKDVHHEKEKHMLEKEITELKQKKVDQETQLRAKITSLESQILSTETAKTHEKSLLIEKITHYKILEKESIEKEIKAERKIEELEQINTKLQGEVSEKVQACDSLQEEVRDRDDRLMEKSAQMTKLEEDLKTMQEKLENSQEKMKSKSGELAECCKERDSLMLRNAELSQQVTALQCTSQEDQHSHVEEMKSKTETENLLRQQCDQLQEKVEHYEQRLKEASEAEAEAERQSESTLVLQQAISNLEDQLAEKNKALKKQDQRLTDLKKTLQRELKVQSLPNDEPLVAALTPPPQRKHSASRSSASQDISHKPKLKGQSSFEKVLEPVSNVAERGQFINSHERGSKVHDKSRTSGPSLFDRGQNSYDQFLPHRNDLNQGSLGVHTNSSHSREPVSREWDTRHLEKDVNFQYLKHVVMKFMLSRESEAVHLIKAISLLLRLSAEEQKLMRDTLEWKMSWFGGSQPPAVLRGQSSKIIPPSF